MLRTFNRAISFHAYYSSCIQYQVIHDKKLKEFYLGDRTEKAVLHYQEVTPSVILLEHTIVPKGLQGKGLGKLLVEAAFEYAIDKNLKVKVSCDFVQKYLQKDPKPEFLKILHSE